MSVRHARSYVAAMMDGEGWVSADTRMNNRKAEIAGTCPETIYATRCAMDLLGIKTTMESYQPKNPKGGYYRRCFKLIIHSKKSFEVLSTLPMYDPGKIERIKACLNAYVGRWPKKETVNG